MRSKGEHIDGFGVFVFYRHFLWRNGSRFFWDRDRHRCPACGSLTHGFKSDKVGDLDTGHAYFVCRKCGDKQLKGQVAADGSVMCTAAAGNLIKTATTRETRAAHSVMAAVVMVGETAAVASKRASEERISLAKGP